MANHEALIDSASTQPLSIVLPRVISLAQSVGDEDLLTWARLELLGYTGVNPAMTERTAVPEYRAVGGAWFDGHGRRLRLEPGLAFVNETRLREGVGELETYVGQGGILTYQMPEFSDLIKNHLGVEVSDFRFDLRTVEQVLANIRAQLVHRLIKSSTEFGSRATTPEIQPTNTDSNPVWYLRPTFYGIGIDLRAAWRRLRAWWISQRRQ